MKRRTLAVLLGTALFTLAIGSIAQGKKYNTSIFANSSGGTESTSVYGSLTSPFDNCKKRRVVTITYTSTTGVPVTVTDKTDVTGGFRVPDPLSPTELAPAGGPITVSVKKKRVKPFKEEGESVRHICKKKSVSANPLTF